MDDTAEDRIVVERTLDASPDQVWRAWTDPQLIRRWWGPTGFTCPLADVDVRVGGSTLVAMQAPAEQGGGRWHNRWTYTVVEPPRQLEFTSSFVDGAGDPVDAAATGSGGLPQLVPHVVELRPLPAGRTLLRVTEHGYQDERLRRQSQHGQEQCLDKMRDVLQGS